MTTDVSNLGKKIVEEFGTSNNGTPNVWVDTKNIDVTEGGLYFVQYTQFGAAVADATLKLSMITLNETYAATVIKTADEVSCATLSAIIPMAGAGRITLRNYTSVAFSGRQRRIACYKLV